MAEVASLREGSIGDEFSHSALQKHTQLVLHTQTGTGIRRCTGCHDMAMANATSQSCSWALLLAGERESNVAPPSRHQACCPAPPACLQAAQAPSQLLAAASVLTRSPRVMRMLSSRNTTSKRAERTPLGVCNRAGVVGAAG